MNLLRGVRLLQSSDPEYSLLLSASGLCSYGIDPAWQWLWRVNKEPRCLARYVADAVRFVLGITRGSGERACVKLRNVIPRYRPRQTPRHSKHEMA
jgi:hypothetical protein